MYKRQGSEFEGWLKVAWNSDTNLWEFSQIFSEDGKGIEQQVVATSPDLYNSEWTMLTEQFPPIGTSQGEEFSCDLRYCFNASSLGFTYDSSLYASWNDIPLTESPNTYITFEGDPIFWSSGDTSWAYGFREPILLGGTRDELPTGSFNLGMGGTLNINSGVCEVTPLPTPSPYYTDFPDIVNQEVYIQTDGSFQMISQNGVTYNISATLNEGGNTALFSIRVQEDFFDNFFKDSEVEYDIQNALVYIHDNIGDTDYNNLINEFPIPIGMRSYTLYLTLDTTVNHNFSIFYFTGTAGDGEFINIINVSGNMDNAGLSLRPR